MMLINEPDKCNLQGQLTCATDAAAINFFDGDVIIGHKRTVYTNLTKFIQQ